MDSQAEDGNSLGRRLKLLRVKLGLTQMNASQLTGIPIDTWRSWESGRRKPPKYVETMLALLPELQDRFLNDRERRELALAVKERLAALRDLRNAASGEAEIEELSESISALERIEGLMEPR